MFIPKYTITDQLLTNITQINTLIRDFNERRFPKVILVEFEKIAREVSTFASTSIEGNPLPLTEVKKVLRSKPVNIRNSEKEVINYNQAIKTLHQQLQTNRLELSLNLILYIHKQMVIIHPFMDGNGRTTRLITKVLLAKMGLNTFNLFSFENYYNQNVTKYFQTVGEYGDYNEISTSIDFTDWLEYFTGGLIDELMRVKKLLPNIGVTPDTQLEIHHLSILEYIKKNNFITDRNYAKLTDRAKATRTLDFQKLIDLDLIERKGKGRSTFYVLKKD